MEQQAVRYTSRWLIRRDLTDLASWEMDTPRGWDADRYIRAMQVRNQVSLVVETATHVVGVIVYRLLADRIEIRRISVHPDHRRKGVGRILIEKLKHRLSAHATRFALRTQVREDDLKAQLFFKAMGFTGKSYNGKIRFEWVLW
jgi:ribosomal protein S18 acetylase RimI-like enzyme